MFRNPKITDAMKRILASYLGICLTLAGVIGAVADDGVRLPPFRKLTLTNGLTLLLLERHQVPLVSFRILIRAGGVHDPVGREGLALLTAELLQHGTQHRTASQVAAELDFIGATLEAGGDADRTWLSGEFMRKDAAAALALLSDLLQHPSFPSAEVRKLVKQEVDGIKQAKEEAGTVLPLYFAKALYGSHPYGRPTGGDESSLAPLRRADITAFYQSHYAPAAAILVLAGDFASAEMERVLTDKFGGWTARVRHTEIQVPAPTPVSGRHLLLVNKPDSPQTFFAIGQVGIARDNPDRTGLELVNLLFGGRFTSMLNEALRVNSGLTYGAHSRFQPHRAAGPFMISSFTATATTTNALDLALEVLDQLHRQGISEDQLRSAKDYLKGQYPLRLETPDQLAALLADLEFFGLDPREVNEFFQRVDAFTTTDARRLIKQYFPQENLVITLIGKAVDIETAVKKYAPRTEKREIGMPGYD